MSTRAIYTFRDEYNLVHVYKHHDGYPSGASRALLAAQEHAWEESRYEADEFAASFVSANKNGSGGMRLIGAFPETPSEMRAPEHFAADTEYLYEITDRNAVRAWHSNDGKRATETPFFTGTFAELGDLAP